MTNKHLLLIIIHLAVAGVSAADNNVLRSRHPIAIEKIDAAIGNSGHNTHHRHHQHRRRRRRAKVLWHQEIGEDISGVDDNNIIEHQQDEDRGQQLRQLPPPPSAFPPSQFLRQLRPDNNDTSWNSTTSSTITTSTNINNNNNNNTQLLLKQPRIIGGRITPTTRHPYVASLLDTISNTHVCGGTLIAPDIILTAGHCSGFFDSIQVGLHNILDNNPTPANLYGTYNHLIVEEHRAHPQYGNVIMYDVAIAKLYGVADTVTPVRVNNRRNVPVDNDILTVLGWGVTQEGVSSTSSELLRAVNVSSISNEECEQSSGLYEGQSMSFSGYILDNMMCAHGEDKDACQGDSGGPLMKVGKEQKDDVQLGIVSWGLGCALNDFPGVYTRLSADSIYEGWLRESVCEMSSDPPSYLSCDELTFPAESRGDALTEVTIAIETDDRPQDTSFVLEEDPLLAQMRRSNGIPRSTYLTGVSQVPFDTYQRSGIVEEHKVLVAQNEQFRLTLLDRMGDGLQPKTEEGRQSRFRMCHGSVGGAECINAPSTSDLVICSGSGSFTLAKSIICFVEAAPTPQPTPPPILDPLVAVPNPPPIPAPTNPPIDSFYVDLDLFPMLDDAFDSFRPPPPTDAPNTLKPTVSMMPSPSSTMAPTKVVPLDFLTGTAIEEIAEGEFELTKVTAAPTFTPVNRDPLQKAPSDDSAVVNSQNIVSSASTVGRGRLYVMSVMTAAILVHLAAMI